MKAAIFRGIETIRLEETEVPEVPPNHVLVDTKVTGICGSDLHQYYGNWAQSEVASGHEFAGIVTEIGDGTSKVKVGDSVCIECFSHCGSCTFCQTGLYNMCENRRFLSKIGHAGFSEYSLLDESSLFKLPQEMSFEEGALVEPLAVALRAVYKTNVGHRESLAILGAGTIGLLCLASAKVAGVGEILISTKYPQQTELAKQFGADHIIQVTGQSLEEEFKAITGNEGVDAVVETVGSSQALNDAIKLTRAAGTVCLVSGYTKEVSTDLAGVVGKELKLEGSNCYGYSGGRKDFDTAIDLIASRKVTPMDLVTHKFPLEQIEEAFRVAANKTTGSIKVLITQSRSNIHLRDNQMRWESP